MRCVRLSSSLAGAVALAGCAMAPFDERAAYVATTDLSAVVRPMAQLPDAAGAQISILQSNQQGPITQRIILQGDAATGGENRITVSVDMNQPMPGEADYKIPKPTDETIGKELDDTMPGIAMAISPNFERNDFGPFGYALGNAYGGVTCIYAWQWAPGQPVRYFANPEAQAADASRPKWPTSVRVRLCKQGYSEAQLVDLLRHLAVYPPGSTAPYLDATYGPRPLVAADPLASSGVPRAFYLGEGAAAAPAPQARPRVARVEEKPEPRAKKHRRKKDEADERDDTPRDSSRYEQVRVAPLAGSDVSVPMPGEGGPAGGAASSALVAPLKGMQTTPARAPASDLPLPPALIGSTQAAPGPALPLPQ